MVFQSFQLFPHLSVLKNIMTGLIVVQKWPVERARPAPEALLAKVGLLHAVMPGRRCCPAASSSGGADCPGAGAFTQGSALR